MVKISPPIDLRHGPNAKIDLFLGVVRPNAYAYFSGWGCISQDYRQVINILFANILGVVDIIDVREPI